MIQSAEFVFDEIIPRLIDPSSVHALAIDPRGQNPSPLTHQGTSWSDLSLANGYPSLLLLFAMLNRKKLLEESGERIVHQYALKIKEAVESRGISSLSLYSGAAGICFAFKAVSYEEKSYDRILRSLHEFLLQRMQQRYFDRLSPSIADSRSSPSHLYDVIQGISGIGRYCLENLSDPQFLELAQKIASALISLCQYRSIEGHSVPGWHLSPSDPTNSLHAGSDGKGNFNLGLAHGVPGVLAFLAIASLKGVTVSGQRETIESISEWLMQRSFVEREWRCWPSSVSFEEEIGSKPMEKIRSRDAWCYGVPGAARALFLAGQAMNSDPLKAFAGDTFRDLFLRSSEEWNLPGPSLCHGIAGLLMTTCEMSKERGYEDLRLHVNRLTELLLSYYQPEAPFGFQDLEPTRQGGLAAVDNPGLLEGTTGILLTLLSLSDPAPSWHLPLLLHA